MILGGGAGGLMCAAWLRQHSAQRIAVVEGNAKAGAKLKISGGGKCNITNVDVRSRHYLGDEAFVETVLGNFDKQALLDFLHVHGIALELRKGRYYFCQKSSDEIIALLKRLAEGTDFHLGCRIREVHKTQRFVVETDQGSYSADKVIVATGGVSFAQLGASDIGLKIAAGFGHETVPFAPALVGLTLQPEQFWMKSLSGISFPVRITAAGRAVEEDMLFAHKGISGPAVLSASLYWSKGSLSIDFLPGERVEKLCRGKKQVSSAIPLPKRFMKAFLESAGIEDKPCERLGRQEMEKLTGLHDYTFAPAGTFGFSKAEVSKGGVRCEGIDPGTMQSRMAEGLYFVGEVVDVTGELGGYNFQWAFASAVTASMHIAQKS